MDEKKVVDPKKGYEDYTWYTISRIEKCLQLLSEQPFVELVF
jgi:hypothetical protein